MATNRRASKLKRLKVRVGTLVVGTWDPVERVFEKVVTRRKHFLRALEAWGIDARVVAELEKRGCLEVVIYEKDARKTYRVTFSKFTGMGLLRNYGAGPQWFLPENQFQVVADNGPSLFPAGALNDAGPKEESHA